MAIDLVIPVPNVDEIIGTGSDQYDSVRLYSASSRGGTYALVTTVTLVASTTRYSYTDAAGTTSTWYKVTFYNSSTANETSLTRAEPFPAARNTLTRKAIRERIIINFGGKILAPSSITTTTVVDAGNLQDTGADSAAYNGWHIYRPDATSTADNDRRVTAYTNTNGTITHAGANYTDITATSEAVELMPLDIDYTLLNDLINDGLRNTRWLYRLEMGMTSSQNQYPLPYFVEGPEYVPAIWRRFGDTANSYTWKPIDVAQGFARVRGNNFQCILDVDPALGDNEVIGLDIWRPGEDLDAETDFVMVQREWAECASMVSIIEHLMTLEFTRHQTSVWDKVLAVWKDKLRKAARKYGPTPKMMIQPPTRIQGLPQV